MMFHKIKVWMELVVMFHFILEFFICFCFKLNSLHPLCFFPGHKKGVTSFSSLSLALPRTYYRWSSDISDQGILVGR